METGFNTQVGNGEYRLQFETDNREYYLLMQSTARRCVGGGQTTNADRIRSMSDEELAELIVVRVKDIHHQGMRELAYSAWLEWLHQPAEKPKEDA